MMFHRLSIILRPWQTVSKKLIFTNEIAKRGFNGTYCLFSKSSNDGPKKPPNPYLQFFHSVLPELNAKYPETSFQSKIDTCANLWKSMDLHQRIQYFLTYYEKSDQVKFARLQYKCEQQDKPKTEEDPGLMTKKEKKRVKRLRKINGKPKRYPSAFSLFLMTKKNSLPRAQAPNWINDVVKEYQNLSEDERKKFQDEANILKEEYRKKITEWEISVIEKGQTDLLYTRSKFVKKVT